MKINLRSDSSETILTALSSRLMLKLGLTAQLAAAFLMVFCSLTFVAAQESERGIEKNKGVLTEPVTERNIETPFVYSPDATVFGESEPNNTAATATVSGLTVGNPIIATGSITPAGDADFYSFTAPAGAKFWANLDTGGVQNPGATSRDSLLDIIAADGTTVIEADDDDGIGNGGDALIESAAASVIAGRTLTAGGTYYIRVRAFSGVINPYRLLATLTTTSSGESEPNNNIFTNANPLVTANSPTGVRTGAIGTGGDVDFYSITAQAGDNVNFVADCDPERDGIGTDLVVDFYDSSTALLFSADSSITGTAANPCGEGANFNAPFAGPYYIRVRHFSATGFGTYAIMATNNRTNVASPLADLALTMTASSPVAAGGNLTYTVRASNLGQSDASDAVLLIQVPAGTTYQSASFPVDWKCRAPTSSRGSVRCTKETVVAGSEAVFSMRVRVAQTATVGTQIFGQATITTSTSEAGTTNNSAFVTSTVTSTGGGGGGTRGVE